MNLSLTCLAQAPNADWHCFAVRVAFTAWIQYFCDLVWNLENLLNLISNKNQLSAGMSSGAVPARSSSSSIISSDFYFVEVSIDLVVEGYVTEDPLRMCYM